MKYCLIVNSLFKIFKTITLKITKADIISLWFLSKSQEINLDNSISNRDKSKNNSLDSIYSKNNRFNE
jgi:hypothetical protein